MIFTEDVQAIFGPRPWASRSEELLEANSETTTEDNPEANSETNVDTEK